VAFDELAETGVGDEPQHARLLDGAGEVAEADRRGAGLGLTIAFAVT
jgi:hypothetical protein